MRGVAGHGSADNVCGLFFFFQAEDGIRDRTVTGVQTCALPIFRQLQRDQFVVNRGAQEERTIDFCRTAGFEPQIVCECSEQETAISLVQAGLGVMLLPQLAACVLRENVVAMPLREPKLIRQIGLISRRGKELSAAARAFVELIKKAPFPASADAKPRSESARGNVRSHVPETALGQTSNNHSAPQGLLTPLKFLERSAL